MKTNAWTLEYPSVAPNPVNGFQIRLGLPCVSDSNIRAVFSCTQDEHINRDINTCVIKSNRINICVDCSVYIR